MPNDTRKPKPQRFCKCEHAWSKHWRTKNEVLGCSITKCECREYDEVKADTPCQRTECSRLASRVLELEADVTRWQLLAGKLDCKTCTPGLASRVEELEAALRQRAIEYVGHWDEGMGSKYFVSEPAKFLFAEQDVEEQMEEWIKEAAELLAGAHAEEKE